MQAKLFTYLAVLLLVGLIFFTAPVISEMDCAKIPHWSATNPPVNQQHVFCGEWNKRKNRPAGFHSRPTGENPATVGKLKITQQPNAKGLYGVRWSFAGHPNREKFSSMFPDTCNRDQILKSIVKTGKLPVWERIGNAYRLELTGKGALIEDLVDEDSPEQMITLNDFSDAVQAWIEALE